MGKKLTHSQKGHMADRGAELYRITSNGIRDYDAVMNGLQDLIDGRFYDPGIESSLAQNSNPLWSRLPELQLERVHELNEQQGWGFTDSDFPSVPENTSLVDGEVLLLCVSLPPSGDVDGLQRTVNELLTLIEAPPGYVKDGWGENYVNKRILRQAPGYEYAPGIRWVVFYPSTYRSISPTDALKQSKLDNVALAGVEVLMAMLLFPAWTTSWNGNTSRPPHLSGLQIYRRDYWSHVPCIDLRDSDLKLALSNDWADVTSMRFASPTVREC